MSIRRMSKRLTPWMMAVMVSSGISMVLTMRPSVPMGKMSSGVGSSTLASRWVTAPRSLPLRKTSLISWMDLGRPTVTGMTVLGNRIAFLSGRMGRVGGRSTSRSSPPGLSMFMTGMMLTSLPEPPKIFCKISLLSIISCQNVSQCGRNGPAVEMVNSYAKQNCKKIVSCF